MSAIWRPVERRPGADWPCNKSTKKKNCAPLFFRGKFHDLIFMILAFGGRWKMRPLTWWSRPGPFTCGTDVYHTQVSNLPRISAAVCLILFHRVIYCRCKSHRGDLEPFRRPIPFEPDERGNSIHLSIGSCPFEYFGCHSSDNLI